MFCKNCGKEIPDGAGFCPKCGAKTAPGTAQPSGESGNLPSGNVQPEARTTRTERYLVDADRSLLKYILLSIVTCGIYQLYFIHKLSADVNILCEGDGQETAGLLKYILLSLITCGIYSFVWSYSLGNRLSENAPRYGLRFSENGTSVLLWNLFGILLCGIGPFIAMNIIIKNTNALANAYNAN